MARKPTKTANPTPFDVTPEDYRNTFLSNTGRSVLCHMMVDLHFFDECETPAEIAERNYMTRLLRNAGILTPGNVRAIADALLNISLKTKE